MYEKINMNETILKFSTSVDVKTEKPCTNNCTQKYSQSTTVCTATGSDLDFSFNPFFY